MTLNIEMEYETPLDFDYEELAKKVTEAALDYENCPYEAEINLVLTGNEEIQRTNREFREIGELLLGDIMICVPRMQEQAESYGHGQVREFAFLIAHSMLHLMGYDHMTPEEAAVMEKKQAEILEGLRITR